jgi:uncharacterized membrane protein YqhA
MSTITDIKETILARGFIDENAVKQLRHVCTGGNISNENANILFELKDFCDGKSNHATWKPFFIDMITSYLLDDAISPGYIDDNEAKWLRAKIQHDGKLSKTDKALLANLKTKSINFPEILHYKSKIVIFFEVILFSSRFVTFLAVLGSLMAAITLFVLSSIRIVSGLILSIKIYSSDIEKIDQVIAIFVSAIDGYLFSMVLLIFGIGIYELFINKIDVVNKTKDSKPNWLIIESIDDLKASLGKVILMILIVSFFEHSLQIYYKNINDLLFLGIGVLLISAALFLTHQGKHKFKQDNKMEMNN